MSQDDDDAITANVQRCSTRPTASSGVLYLDRENHPARRVIAPRRGLKYETSAAARYEVLADRRSAVVVQVRVAGRLSQEDLS